LEKPNVLLIISDDQGFCELGSYSDFANPATMGAIKIQEWRKITKTTNVEAPISVCMETAKKLGISESSIRYHLRKGTLKKKF